MKLIVGLGNPDEKYKKTRHNIGFRILNELVTIGQYNKLEFKEDKKFFGQYTKKQEFILLKPMTYMNRSGQSVLAIKQYYNIESENILVVHDDMDLGFGQIKMQKEKSAAGHNGVDSIINSLGSNNFWRLRIGINNDLKEKIPGDKFVIYNFSSEEEKKFPQIIDYSLDLIIEFIEKKHDKLTNKNFKIPV